MPLDGEPADLERMALLFAHLPAKSRTARRQAPELEWSAEAYLLRLIENDLACLIWFLSDPKDRSADPPTPVETPGELAAARERQEIALAMKDEITKRLGLEGRV